MAYGILIIGDVYSVIQISRKIAHPPKKSAIAEQVTFLSLLIY